MADFTDYSERISYVGSFCRWTSQGRHELITKFQTNYPDKDNVPVVSYDPVNDVFCIKSSEPLAVNLFSQLLKGQIDFNRHNDDHISEELLVPIEYTTLPKDFDSPGAYNDLHDTLIDIDDDSDESTEDSSSGGGPCAYWTPRCGDVSVLPDDVATKIAEITECFLYKETENGRWRVMHGSIETSIEKLQNLESLLEYLAKHRVGTTSIMNFNLLSFSCQLPGTGIRYFHATNPPHRDRIMVYSPLEDQLEQMLVGEEKVWNQNTSKYSTPDNLLPTQAPDDTSTYPTTIWADFEMPEIGNPQNGSPKTTSSNDSMARAEGSGGTYPIAMDQQTRFLPLQEQVRVEEWSIAVDPGADPAIAAEEPIEPEVVEDQSGLTKRRVEDSDSDTDVFERSKAESHTTKRTVSTLSDSGSESSPGPRNSHSATKHSQYHQPIGIHNVKFGHINRAERKTVPPPALITAGNQVPTKFVSSETFFEGVPRDEDAGDHSVSIQDEKQSYRLPKVTNSSRFTNPEQTYGRQPSYDGAADAVDEEDIHKVGQHSSLAPEDPETVKSQQLDLHNDFHTTSSAYSPSNSFDHTRYGLQKSRGSVQARKQDIFSPQHGRNQSSSSTEKSLDFSFQAPKPTTARRSAQAHSSPKAPAKDTRIGASPVPKPSPFLRSNAALGHTETFKIAQAGVEDRKPRLIDYEEINPHTKPVVAPPGFTPQRHSARPSEGNIHALDSPPEDVQVPTLQPITDQPVSSSEDVSVSTSSSSGRFRHSVHEYIPQTKIIKPDVSQMQNNMLQNLIVARQKEPMVKEAVSPIHQPAERIEEIDEPSTRKYHNTMNLKGPNPGKGRKKTQGNPSKESEAQKRARIAKVKEELHAEATVGKMSVQTTQPEANHQPENLSSKAQQAAIKNPILANMHSSNLQDTERRKCSNELVQAMRPFLEAARAFSGELEFEIQVGKLLVMPNIRINTAKIYERDKWMSLFQKPDSPVEVIFTNMLTNNGVDIDGILQTKTKRWSTWSREMPGPSRIVIEFLCHDNLGQPFRLVLKADGSHATTRGTSIISKIGIHCPGRVWDACAVLTGTASWADPSTEFEQDIKDFVESIHVRSGPYTTIFFRPPTSNCLSVQDVFLKRTSLHDCQVPGEGPLQLKITEVKTMITRNHRTDNRLHVSHEMKHDAMAGKNRVFYEVSVVHKDINEQLKSNQSLEVGELTDRWSTNVISPETAELLLNATFRLVDKIDWVGSRNYGTLVQRQDAKIMREEQIARTLLPSARNPTLVRPVHMPSNNSITSPGTVVRGGVTDGVAFPTAPMTQPIHGIRSGTQAQVYQDADGNLFRLGQGGARIPVALDDGSRISRAEILPDDSASQIGRRSKGLRSRNATGAYPEKPDSFW